jgi:hypothetical protein
MGQDYLEGCQRRGEPRRSVAWASIPSIDLQPGLQFLRRGWPMRWSHAARSPYGRLLLTDHAEEIRAWAITALNVAGSPYSGLLAICGNHA